MTPYFFKSVNFMDHRNTSPIEIDVEWCALTMEIMVGMSFGKHPWNTNMKPKRQDDFPSHFGVVAPGFVGCQSWGSVSFFLLIRKPWDSETHVWIKVHQYTKSLMYTFPCVLQKILLPKFAKKQEKNLNKPRPTTPQPSHGSFLVSIQAHPNQHLASIGYCRIPGLQVATWGKFPMRCVKKNSRGTKNVEKTQVEGKFWRHSKHLLGGFFF